MPHGPRRSAAVPAWVIGTLASAGLAWWSVSAVVADAGRGSAAPIVVPSTEGLPAVTAPRTTDPAAVDVTPDGAASASGSPSTPANQTAAPPVASPTASGSVPPDTYAPGVDGHVEVRTVRGGSVTLRITDSSASLVAATPGDGYTTQINRNTGWLRVDFIGQARTSSVFVTWYQHVPSIQTVES